MSEFKAPAAQQNKTATPVQAPKEASSLGETEYVDSRASTFQFIQLQAAADDQGKGNRITQLQSKSAQFTGFSRVAQLQAKRDSQISSTQSPVVQREENKTGLPDGLKSGMESISGFSLDDVKVYRNSDKPAQLQAHAYAQGTDIHLGPGQEKHLPHELGHVVQQKEGRVKPTVQLKGKVNINDDSGLEKEADSIGANALKFGSLNSNSATNQTVQTRKNDSNQKVIQKVDTVKTSDAQTTARDSNPVDKKDAMSKIKSDSVRKPEDHPMYGNFKNRINQLFTEYPAPSSYNTATLPLEIWTSICSNIEKTNSSFDRKVGNDTYSNEFEGWVDMDSKGFNDSLVEFDTVMKTLQSISQSQFDKAKTYGFYSKPEGKEFAEKMTDLTLDTSGIGALFDGVPSLNAHANGWDVQLWGALSQAYGEAVGHQLVAKDKKAHVCAGGGTDKGTIFAKVEQKAIEKGISKFQVPLEKVMVYHAVAAQQKKDPRKVDYSVAEGSMGLPGTWYSGSNWDESLRIGKEKFELLPDKKP